MKLAVVTNILTPYRLPLFEGFARSTKECTVFLQAEREENRQWQLRAVTFKTEVLPGFHFRPRGSEVAVHVNYGVLQRLRRLQPDVVLSGGFASANIAAYIYCKLFGKRYVQWGELTLHDGAHRSPLRRTLRRLLIGGADGCIASSKTAQDAFVHYGANVHSILTASVPFEVEALHEQVRVYREQFRANPIHGRYPGPVLLSIGQLITRKGFDELFAIYREIVGTRPETTLLLVGDGPCRQTYEQFVRSENWPHVNFLGHLKEDELAQSLAQADVFVFPTRYDAYGLVLAEAMAAELPVVSSIHAAATHDLVEEGVTGFKIDPSDVVATAGKILDVLALSDKQRHAIGQAAYVRVRSCDTEPTADRMIRFLRTIVYSVPTKEKGLAQSFE
jgi:glycosyltransferase involved in cell wall biosynthesis